MRFEEAIRGANIRHVEPRLRERLKGLDVTSATASCFELLNPGVIFDLQDAKDALFRRKDLRFATAAELLAFAPSWKCRKAVVAVDQDEDGYVPVLIANGYGTALVRCNTRGVALDDTEVLCVKINSTP